MTVGEVWARLSLRARLLVSVLTLLALALAATGVTVSVALQGYLSQRVDAEMARVVESLRRGPLERPLGGPRPRLELPSRYAVTVLGSDGSVLVEASDPVGGGQPPDLAGVDARSATERAGSPYTLDAEDGTPWRVLLTPVGGGRTFALATSLADVAETTARIRRTIFLVGLAVLALGAVAGTAAVRGSLLPLRRIEETADAIAGGDLARRVPDEGAPNTEVGRLSRSLNGMLAQIESAFAARTESEQRIRRFMADASHELRTPLTSIRGFAELYRQGAVGDDEDLRRVMARIEAEATRMGGLVDDLLLLARLDEQRPLRRDVVDLVVLAADAVHDGRATAPHHGLRLDAPDDGAGVPVRGDEARLRQVLLNLVTNAIRHTPPGTTITVRVLRQGSEALLEVIDDGPGLPPTEGSVFDGFTRGDRSRARGSGGGSGLGLAIVAALVRGHGGEVDVESEPGQGATFRVRLPLAVETGPPEGRSRRPDSQGTPRLP